jgi:hypothetical protein
MLFKTVIQIFMFSMATMTTLGTMVSQLCIVEELLAKLPSIRVGSGTAGITRQRYIDRLTWIKELLRQSSIINWRDRQNFARVSQALEVLKLEDSNGSIRKQPYCVVLTGFPGCGKSRYALEIATACLRERYGIAYAGDIVTLNETDEYQSEYRTNHKVVIFDDLGAEKIKANTVNPWRKVIDFVNNIRKTSLNPNVEMKGNVYIEPDLVIITTNLSDQLSVSAFMATPGAIYRRIKKFVKLENGYENARLYPFIKVPGPDIRVFDNLKVDTTQVNTAPIISREVLLNDIISDFQRHLEEQEDFVRETNNLLDKIESKTIFQSIYSDIILPIIPSKISLDPYMEARLPWYQRFKRWFCVENKQIAICQSNLDSSIDLSERLISQSGIDNEDLTSIEESQVQFFKNYIDWDWYSCLPKLYNNVLVYEDAIFDMINCNLYSKKVQKESRSTFVGGVPSTIRILEIAKRLYELENFSISVESTDTSISKELKIPMEHQLEDSLNALYKTKSKWGDEGLSIPKDILPRLLKSDDIVSLLSSDLSKPFGQGFRTVITTAPTCLSLIGYEVDLKYCKPDLIYRHISERYGFVYVIVEIVTKGLSKGVKQLSKSISNFRSSKEDSLDKEQIVGVLLTPHHFKIEGKQLAVQDINLKQIANKWHKQIKDRCGAVGLKEKEQLAKDHSEYIVNDPVFGTAFMRQTEIGDIPYDLNGNFNYAMFARDL